jgi:hypothetical protein
MTVDFYYIKINEGNNSFNYIRKKDCIRIMVRQYELIICPDPQGG